MSRVRADRLVNRAATKAPQLTYGAEVPVGYGITGAGGVNVSGACTASAGFVGDITGTATYTGNAGYSTSSGISSALTGTPDITINNLTGVAATFTGVLTYEDVTNVDSTGIVTARGGVKVGSLTGTGVTIGVDNSGDAIFAGIVTAGTCFKAGSVSGGAFGAGVGVTITGDGNIDATGIVTATKFVGLSSGTDGVTVGVGTTATILKTSNSVTQNSFGGVLKEKCSIQGTNVTSGSIDLAQGNVHYFTSNGSGNTTADIIYDGGNNVSGFMTTGDNLSVSIISKPNNSEYISAVTIDGAAVTEEWSGGVPSSASGGASTWTITTLNITRVDQTGTPNTDYLVLCQATNFE